MILVSDVQGLLAVPKRLARGMSWQRNRGNHVPPDMVFRSAVQEASGATIEGLLLRCHWKPPDPPLPETYSFGLYWEEEDDREARIFAYDLAPLDFHHLRRFPGLPLNKTRVQGSHRHIWTDYGYGYVEPIDERPGPAALWESFCTEAGLMDAPFYGPTDQGRTGQMSLL